MQINYSGWKKDFGSFDVNVFVDETKTDYEIRFKNGEVWKQCECFEKITADWNNDGDVYSRFGAWFEVFNKAGQSLGREFFTPVEMVRAIVDKEAVVIGLDEPVLKKKTLEDHIIQSERRAEAQEIERNRKMAALGIRHPGEPWAR